MLKEILTRAVLAKGKIEGVNEEIIQLENTPSKLVGCWVINNNCLSVEEDQKVYLEGSYDIHVWYAINEDSDSVLEKKTIKYKEEFLLDEKIELNDCDYKLYCNEYPRCVELKLDNGKAHVNISKNFSLDIIGESKFVVDVNEGINGVKIDTDYLR